MSVTKNRMLRIAGLIFAIITLGHLLRLLFSLDVIIGNFNIPKFVSVPALLFFAFLTFLSFKASRQ